MVSTSELKIIKPNTNEMQKIMDLLSDQNIRLDDFGGTTFGFYDTGKLAGTATVMGNTLRSVAVSKSHQGTNTLALMVQDILEDLIYQNVYVYTSEKAASAFEHIGFYKIESAEFEGETVVLLEKKPDGFKRYLKRMGLFKLQSQNVGAIVMNCNPFTLGHLYLIETAASKCDHLYVFVVSEDASTFSYDVRMRLIVEGTAHITNLTVIKGGDYIISQATFPSYFLKKLDRAVDLQAQLDLKIFGGHIAQCMGITKRFFGEEPYCETTKKYNDYMKQLLPLYQIEAIEIPRKQQDGEAISASRVRRLIKSNDWEAIKKIVPITTYEYLVSFEAKKTINKIKANDTRH